MVVKEAGFRRRTLDCFLFRVEPRNARTERLCARVLERRSVARSAAVTSGEGGSPKTKNLMKAPMRMTIDSWPKRRPWVKERLGNYELVHSWLHLGDLRRLDLWRRHIGGSHFRDKVLSCVHCGCQVV